MTLEEALAQDRNDPLFVKAYASYNGREINIWQNKDFNNRY